MTPSIKSQIKSFAESINLLLLKDKRIFHIILISVRQIT